MAILKEKRETWKIRYEEAMIEAKMFKTIKEIKSLVWHYVVDDLPKTRDHLKLFLEFEKLHTQMTNYLNNTKKEIQGRHKIA